MLKTFAEFQKQYKWTTYKLISPATPQGLLRPFGTVWILIALSRVHQRFLVNNDMFVNNIPGSWALTWDEARCHKPAVPCH